MEHMIKVLLTPAWKLALEKLEQLNFNTDDYTDLQWLEKLMKKNVRRTNQLDRFFKAMNKMKKTPQTIVKQAVFMHVYLQNTNDLDQATVLGFMNHLLALCEEVAQEYGEGDNNETPPGGLKSAYTRSQASTREDQAFFGKEIFLITKIAKPYIRYVCKLISIFQDYKGLGEIQSTQTPLMWQLINLLRSVTNFTNHFIMIGRYFMKEYGALVVFLTEAITKDLIKYMNLLRNYVKQQNYILSCSSSHNSESECEIEQFMNILKELTQLNDELIQIYLGKYFYREFRQIKQPEWINTSCSQFDTIFKISDKHFKNPQKKQGEEGTLHEIQTTKRHLER